MIGNYRTLKALLEILKEQDNDGKIKIPVENPCDGYKSGELIVAFETKADLISFLEDKLANYFETVAYPDMDHYLDKDMIDEIVDRYNGSSSRDDKGECDDE